VLGLGIGLGLAFFKDLCDKNADHKLLYNMDRWIITQHSPGATISRVTEYGFVFNIKITVFAYKEKG